MATAPIERYVLYGEPVREVELNFLHVEPLPLRSGRHGWSIEPHSHAELHQLMLVTAGGGMMRVEGSTLDIVPPALLVIPSGTVHGFSFAPAADGWVASIAEGMVSEAAGEDAAIAALLAEARSMGKLGAAVVANLLQCFEALTQELVWSAAARRLAIRAELLRLLVTAARLHQREGGEAALASRDVALTERFRRQIDRDFRRGEPVRAYARTLGVSEDRLLGACQRRFGEPPLAMIHRRIMLEAQRWLAYTHKSVGEIGHELGFPDPAYFSRFFKRHAGTTPRGYREATRRRRDDAPSAD